MQDKTVHNKKPGVRIACRRYQRGTMLTVVSLLLVAPLQAGTVLEIDESGTVKAARSNGLRMPCRIDLRVATPGWRKTVGLDAATQTRYKRSSRGRHWSGTLALATHRFLYEIIVGESSADAAPVTVSLTSLQGADLEGIYLFVEVPVHRFQGGTGRIENPDDVIHSVDLPTQRSGDHRLMEEIGSGAVLTDAGGREEIHVNFTEARWLSLQDNRRWSSATFAFYTPLHEGATVPGQTMTLDFEIEFVAPQDSEPAVVTLDPRRGRFPFEGFGGNYCFQLDSPVTAYNRETLRSGWVRMEMSLYMWEPDNDNDDPDTIRWLAFEKNDVRESPLHREFQFMQGFKQDGARLCLSIWHLPAWMYDGPRRPLWTVERRLKPGLWKEVVESVAAFLLYAKHKYDVEPDLISFNEPDLGVYTYLDIEEHRQAIIRLGTRLRALKLSTRVLAGDTGSAVAIEYGQLQGKEVLAHAGALAFHTWKSDARDYAKWRALATRLDLPLYVTEAGVDAGAHRTPWKLDAPHYAMDELRLYQELLRSARPQGVMYWQFAPDYRLAVSEAGVTVAGMRHEFMKHFCNLTPIPAIGFHAESSSEHVQVTAFADDPAKPTRIVIHLANYGAKRRVTVNKIPANVRELIPVVSTYRLGFQRQPALAVAKGRVILELPAESMVSLTVAASFEPADTTTDSTLTPTGGVLYSY